MAPSRLKLTLTVTSTGPACDGRGCFQQLRSCLNISLRVSICCALAGIGAVISTATANQSQGLPRCAMSLHLMSDATCTFTILSGSVTLPLLEPGGAFFSLSTTSMPCTTSPITVYWLLRKEASAKQMKNCALALSTLSPRLAMPTTPRLKGVEENSCFRFGYFEAPEPLNFSPSPVCAMKPSITRWNGTLL